jgi:hypothetical protein
LHEYFLPPERLNNFLVGAREIIPGSAQELLNVTLRYVEADTTSVMSFAPAPRIAAVMLFSQLMTREADEDMRTMTERLIDRAVTFGGSYYLPYRLHARLDQLARRFPGSGNSSNRSVSTIPKLDFATRCGMRI